MAISVTEISPKTFGFVINATSADLSACEVLKAAPAAGKSIIIDHITLNNGAAVLSLTLGQGETDSAVTSPLLGPVAMAANSTMQFDFRPSGLKMSSATALTIDASGAGAVCIFCVGRVE